MQLLRIRAQSVWLAVLLAMASALVQNSTAQAQDSVFDGFFELFGGTAKEPAAVEAEAVVIDVEVANQFTPVLKTMLAIELRYLKKVCEPNKEQLDQIRTAGLAEVRVLANKCGAAERANVYPRRYPDARKLLGEALLKKVTETMPAEAATRYRDELAARVEARRRAAQGMIVNIIDRKLHLTAEQYEQVREAVNKTWKSDSVTNLQVLLYDQYAPVPDISTFSSVLNDRQRAAWRAQPNHGSISFGWQQDLAGMQFSGEQVDVEEELKE